jgi:uncharacterized protein (DUF486 family)
MGQMHRFVRETVTFHWNGKIYTNPAMTFHLIFITWGTLLLEYQSYIFRNKEGELQESAAHL